MAVYIGNVPHCIVRENDLYDLNRREAKYLQLQVKRRFPLRVLSHVTEIRSINVMGDVRKEL